MAKFVKKCPCLRPPTEEVRILDYRHSSLVDVPGEVFNFERTLEELNIDSNQIRDLPRELFYCHGLRKLSISDNEIISIPAAISSLVSLEELDLSKNGIIDIPESIKACKYLKVVDASVNPLGKLPDGISQLLNLQELYLNDTFLDYLPGNFGRLSKLRILEIRENHLKTLPKSFSRLTELERLDVGNNEFTELSDVIGSLVGLLELWCDSNQLRKITPTIGNLKQLMFLDASKNKLQSIPAEIDGCLSLADLHLTSNQLQALPETLGKLADLTTLKVDDNQLVSLPSSVGGLTALSELNVSTNNLEDIPPTIGLLRYLRTFYVDENYLEYIPAEIGSCSGITVLSLRSNCLSYIPDEIGRIPHLRVLNLSNNQLKHLPFSIVKLKELQALWLAENQTRPLIPLQSDVDPDTGCRILTCYLFPQSPHESSGETPDDVASFHASLWEEERARRQQIHFEFGEEDHSSGKLIRIPTPYPKEMKDKIRHVKNLATRQILSANGDPTRNHGHENKAFETEHGQPGRQCVAMSSKGSSGDVRVREARISKSSSPSLQDSHKLFRYDKEITARDKARMQQRHSGEIYKGASSPTKKSAKGYDERPDRTNCQTPDKYNDQKSRDNSLGVQTGQSCSHIPQSLSDFQIYRGTKGVENDSNAHYKMGHDGMSSFQDKILAIGTKQRNPPNYHHLIYRHSHEKHSQQRYRDYDSDTGYRSDQDGVWHQRYRDLAMRGSNFSIPMSHRTRHSGRKDGYLSDLEGYVRHEAQEISFRPIQQQHRVKSLPYNLHSQKPPGPSPSKVLSNDQLYDKSKSNLRTKKNIPENIHIPSSTANFQDQILDQSTPRSTDPPQNFSLSHKEGETAYCQKPSYQIHDSLYTVLEDSVLSANASGVIKDNQSDSSRPCIPPPYQPTPPYRPTSARQRQELPYQYSSTDQFRDFSKNQPTSYHVGNTSSKDTFKQQPDVPLYDYRLTGCANKSQMNSNLENAHIQDSNRGDNSDSCHSGFESPQDSLLSRSEVGGLRRNPRDSMNYSGVNKIRGHLQYDDVAIFKSMEPPSQVSSSTDSGYGQHVYERAEFSNQHRELNETPGGKMLQSSPRSYQGTTASDFSSLPSREVTPSKAVEVCQLNEWQPRKDVPNLRKSNLISITISKNPGLGFSIAGGIGSCGNPYDPDDLGIFITKVQQEGPAMEYLRPGDKIIKVNGIDFTHIQHDKAVAVMKNNNPVCLLVHRK